MQEQEYASCSCFFALQMPRLGDRLRWLRVFAALGLLIFCRPTYAQQGIPQISKIEPPDWWAGLPSPTLLIYGSGLSDAQVRLVSGPAGVSIGEQRPGKDGLYRFVTLAGVENAKPVRLTLQLRTSSGEKNFSYELQPRSKQPAPPALSSSDVIYLIMPDRFADGDLANDHTAKSPDTYDRSKARAYHGGDLKGIRDHLDYLQDLGVNLLWLTPVLDNDDYSAQDYHGYGAVDFYAIDEHFGTLPEYKSLIDEMHRRGMHVYMDDVVNHTGPRHVWAQHPPSDCWLHGTVEHHPPFSDDFLSITDPHATRLQWYNTIAGWFAGVLPDLDNDCPEMEKYLFQHAVWWHEKTGIDGFRLDTFPYSSRRFWAKWHDDLRKLYPDISDIGEVFNGDPVITSFFQGGRKRFDGLDSGVTTVFDFPTMFAVREILTGKAPAKKLATILGRDSLYPHPEKLVTFFSNHDLSRMASLPDSSPEKLKIAFGLLATLRGIPQLYAGDEIGMEGGDDPDNRRDFPGGFPGDAMNAFAESGRTAAQKDIFNFARAALRLRKAHAALRDGALLHVAATDNVYVFVRRSGDDVLLVTMNASSQPETVEISNAADGPLPGAEALHVLLSSVQGAPATASFTDGRVRLQSSAASIAIYSVAMQRPHAGNRPPYAFPSEVVPCLPFP